MCGSKESAADPAAGEDGMNEEKEQLAAGRMSGCVADDPFRFLDRDQQHVRRQMIRPRADPSTPI